MTFKLLVSCSSACNRRIVLEELYIQELYPLSSLRFRQRLAQDSCKMVYALRQVPDESILKPAFSVDEKIEEFA